MPIFWQNQTNGTAPIQAVPTFVTAQGLSQLYQTQIATTTGLYQQAMMSQTTATQSLTSLAATIAYYNTATGDIWVDNSQYYNLAQQRAATFRVRTQEELVRHQEQQRQAQLAMEQRRRETMAALARSRELLIEHLSAEQRATFEGHKWFVVEGGKTKQKYRIRTESYAGNIDVLNGSRVSHRLCVHCDRIPLYDHHLAQKLALEYDEERLLKIANRQAA
jgi:hypothetical protein